MSPNSTSPGSQPPRDGSSPSLFANASMFSPIERDRLARLRAEHAQHGGLVPLDQVKDSFGSMLPPPGDPLRRFALQELIYADLIRRWQSKEPVFLERYLDLFPELGGPDGLVVQLIYEEFLLRKQRGDSVPLSVYRQRFPRQFEDLEQFAKSDYETANWDAPLKRGSFGKPPGEIAVPGGTAYKLMKRIGHGSYGAVYRGEAPGGIEVAIKLVRLDRRLSDNELRALEVMKALRNTFLVPVHASWESDDMLVIVMELADGSLDDRRDQCREAGEPGIPVTELTRYMLELAEALDYLHAQGRVHRDVKPANVLLMNGHAKLGDFGLARLYRRDQMDMTATLGGTPIYMAPEVWRNRVGPRSDQYSLAATYAEMRLNRPLFDARSPLELLNAHTTVPPDLKGMTPSEERVVARALTKEPGDRFASCLEFAQALQEAVARDAAPIGDSEPPPNRRHWLVAAAVLLVAGLAGVAAMSFAPTGLELVTPGNLRVPAGSERRFAVYLRGASQPESLTLLSRANHDGITIDNGNWNSAEKNADLTLTVDANVPSGNYLLTLDASGSIGKFQKQIELIVESPQVLSLASYEPTDEARLVRIDAERFAPSRIRSLAGGVELILIPRQQKSDPSPFYIMQDKVTRRNFRQFSEFAAGNAEIQLQSPEWRNPSLAPPAGKSEDEQLPVMNITIDDACQFAGWLGGRLPSRRQWDKAAGALEPADRGVGPFEGDGLQAGANVVNRGSQGPLPVDRPHASRSPFGCRDMGGNGREWTRDCGPEKEAPLANSSGFDIVYLRGRSFLEATPLTFAEVDEMDRDPVPYDESDIDIGFRIVVEIPAGR